MENDAIREAASVRRGIVAASAYFGIVFGAGFLLGAVRVPFFVPRIGARYAELVEMPLMFCAIYLAAGYVVSKFSGIRSPRHWVGVGCLSLAMLLLAELLLAVALSGRSIGEYIASRDPVSGLVYLGMLVVFAVMPRWRLRVARTQNRA